MAAAFRNEEETYLHHRNNNSHIRSSWVTLGSLLLETERYLFRGALGISTGYIPYNFPPYALFGRVRFAISEAILGISIIYS